MSVSLSSTISLLCMQLSAQNGGEQIRKVSKLQSRLTRSVWALLSVHKRDLTNLAYGRMQLAPSPSCLTN